MLLSQTLADKNSQVMTMYFQLNKKLDNFVNFILVDYSMEKLSEALHKNYAHRAPITADNFSDYNAAYSYRATYGAVEEETVTYGGFLEGVADVLSYLIDIDNALAEARELGVRENNIDYVVFIDEQFKELGAYKKEFVLLYDKAEKYLALGNTLQDIDARYEDFLI